MPTASCGSAHRMLTRQGGSPSRFVSRIAEDGETHDGETEGHECDGNDEYRPLHRPRPQFKARAHGSLFVHSEAAQRLRRSSTLTVGASMASEDSTTNQKDSAEHAFKSGEVVRHPVHGDGARRVRVDRKHEHLMCRADN